MFFVFFVLTQCVSRENYLSFLFYVQYLVIWVFVPNFSPFSTIMMWFNNMFFNDGNTVWRMG